MQVEVSSPPSTSFAEARGTLAGLRASLADIGREHGILVFAAGTHPIARWARQSQTEKERYEALMRQLRMLGQRNVVCGMHVHVEVPRPEVRVDLMNRLLPYMPLLLALSTSSPFWQGRDTGLAGYRMSAFGEMPRTGLPDLFDGQADYDRYVEVMVRAKAIADASFLWWTLRPSMHYPTLELRVADSCTRLEDSLAIAALYRCLVRFVDRRPELNRGLTGASRAFAAENMWRAQRDGVHGEIIDAEAGAAVPFAQYCDRILGLGAEDADAMGCQRELERARGIVAAGTSADRQRAAFAEAREAHARAVSDADFACFCAVERAPDDPRRPADYTPLDGFWRNRGYRPMPGFACTMRWREVGDAEESPHQLNFWGRALRDAPLP